MNLCFLSKEYPPRVTGGVGVYIYEMARTLVEMGHKTHVITMAFDEEGDTCEDGVFVYRVKPMELPFFFSLRNKFGRTIERLEYSFAVSKKLSKIVKKNKIDIVESTDARWEGIWYYLFRKKPPLLVKLHTPESIIFDWNNDPPSLDHSLIKIMEEFWIMRAEKLLSISADMPLILARYYKVNFPEVVQQPNPVNVDLFKPDFTPEKDNGGIVLYAGRLEFRKGVHVLARAIPEVLKECSEAKFVFVGADCGMKPYLISQIKEFGCEKNIVFIDHVSREKLAAYYQESSLCVVPSLWDNFPYSCLEAMSCGKPVVASSAGGIAEIVRNGINGLLVTPGSVKELAQAVIKILKNKAFARRLGEAAAESIKEKYSRFKIAEQSMRIYQSLNG